ncbi:MAG: DUF1836 domain-containing protein [Clostridiaceae bacterium]|nr:DUF1836 domain-containing protein [Oscillospiraceae bacterium]NLO61839.1 DUF1836 domain-containing protein [Clostridiaceae bacterium]
MAKNDSPVISNVKSPKKARDISPERAERFKDWLEDIPNTELTDWERLPDFDLYMDQVLTMMDRQLAFYGRNTDERLLTQAMVNNYTKDGLLPRATGKKYSRGHLALLSILCSLKPVLSISDLSVLLDNARDGHEDRELYDYFRKAHGEAVACVRDLLLPRVSELAGSETEPGSGASAEKELRRKSLTMTALNLAVDARVRVMMAQKIIDMLGKNE